MMRKKDLELTYTGVLVYRKNHILLTAVVDEFEEKHQPHAMVFRRFEGKWYHHLIEHSVSGVAVVEEPRPKVLWMGVDGEITVAAASGLTTEIIDVSSNRPTDLVFLTCIRKIGGHVYVAGMARQAYRRESPDRWARIDKGVFVPREKRKESIGLMDINGLKEDSLWAVGLKGEIWHYDGSGWTQFASPVKVTLTRILCLRDNEIYACGLSGTIIRWDGKEWQPMQHGTTQKSFWGMTYFQGKIFLSTSNGVFVLENETLTPVNFGRKGITTEFIDANDGVMWSVGTKDVFSTEDGIIWKEVDKP